MRRPLRLLLLALLAGAASAYTSSVLIGAATPPPGPPNPTKMHATPDGELLWTSRASRSPTARRVIVNCWDPRRKASPGVLQLLNAKLPAWAPRVRTEIDQINIRCDAILVGWPIPCVRSTQIVADGPVGTRIRDIGPSLRAKLPWTRLPKLIPISPAAAPFALNTAAHTTIWLALITGPIFIRRAIRKRRGLCPLCAYDLDSKLEEGCPECGWNKPATSTG